MVRCEVEDVIELLREKNIPVPVPMGLPDEDMLVAIEEQMLIAIPPDFKQFLLAASDVVYGNIEPATAVDPTSHTYLPEITAEAWNLGVPRHYIVVCEVMGMYYCIAPEGDVQLWQEGEFGEEEWPSIWHWAEDVWLAS